MSKRSDPSRERFRALFEAFSQCVKRFSPQEAPSRTKPRPPVPLRPSWGGKVYLALSENRCGRRNPGRDRLEKGPQRDIRIVDKELPMQILAWVIAGWCGTVIRQIRQPVGPPPSEWPFWDSPNPWLEALIGIVGGIAGGLLFNAVAPGDGLPLVNLGESDDHLLRRVAGRQPLESCRLAVWPYRLRTSSPRSLLLGPVRTAAAAAAYTTR